MGWWGGSQKDLLVILVFGPDACLLEVMVCQDCYQSELEEGNKFREKIRLISENPL